MRLKRAVRNSQSVRSKGEMYESAMSHSSGACFAESNCLCSRSRVEVLVIQEFSTSVFARFAGLHLPRPFAPISGWTFDASAFTPIKSTDRAMLPSSHGASTLGKTVLRPLMTTMSSFEGTSALATDALRASVQRGLGRRSM